MSNKNSKKNYSSFVSFQQERFETEMFNNIEIFEERSKLILCEFEEILSLKEETWKLNQFKSIQFFFKFFYCLILFFICLIIKFRHTYRSFQSFQERTL